VVLYRFYPGLRSDASLQGLLTSDIRGFNTIESFLKGPVVATPAEEESLFAKICKGAMLMEKAFRLVSSLKPGITEEALTVFNRELDTLNKATETFAATLPSLITSSGVNVHTLREQISAHTLVRMAFIHLTIKFAANDISANLRCVEAAIAMVRLLDDADLVTLEILPPIIANAWLMAGQVLIQEMVRLNTIGAQPSEIPPDEARKGEITKLLDRLELMMVAVGTKAPIFSLQHDVLHKRRDEQLVISV